jgi:acetoin utilization deacetylase AcuC-like enzyme
MKVLIKHFICSLVALTSLYAASETLSIEPKVAVIYSDKFLLHKTGQGHPERPGRLSTVVSSLKSNKSLFPFIIWPTIKEADTKVIKLVHTQDYIDLVDREVNLLKGNKTAYLSTGDTVVSKESSGIARLAVGAGLKGADEIMNATVSSAFVLNIYKINMGLNVY